MKIESKICTSCGQAYPATTMYWHKNKSKKDGFANRCKKCISSGNVISHKATKEKELTFQRYPDLELGIGKTYKLTIDTSVQGNGKKMAHFIGTVIQVCDRHITFREKKYGYTESFLIWDLAKHNPVEI